MAREEPPSAPPPPFPEICGSSFKTLVKAVAALSKAEVEAVTSLVNRANAGRREPFVGDRLGADSLVEQYGSGEMVGLFLAGRLIGTMTVCEERAALWVYLLAVDPLHRGERFVHVLLGQASEIALSRGLGWLRLDAVDEGGLVGYYLSLGFEEVERVTKPIGHWGATRPFELVTMERAVTMLSSSTGLGSRSATLPAS